MNSSTLSSKQRAKRYALGLLALVGLEMLVLLGASVYLERPVGDIARLGGYAENDFGWRKPQQVFNLPPGPLRESHDAYDHYSDVVVVGDSFSFAGFYDALNYPWQTVLKAETGLTLESFSFYTSKTNPPSYDPEVIPRLVNSPAFRATPPKVVVVEIVQRQLHMLPKLGGGCRHGARLAAPPDLQFKPNPALAASTEASRSTARPPLKAQFAFAKKYLGQLLWTRRASYARVLDLDTPKLFSSRRSDRLLVIRYDLEKAEWDADKLASIHCRAVDMQDLVQQNGKTLFVLMIAPDKLTAYAKHLRDTAYANASVIGRLAEADPLLHMVRLDTPLRAAVGQGIVDVYLPNDTHWSYLGHRIAGAALAEYLRNFKGDPPQ